MAIIFGGRIYKGGRVYIRPIAGTLDWVTPSASIGSFQSETAMMFDLECTLATTFTLVGGSLPTGLSLSSSGVISGTTIPSADGDYDFIVQASDGTRSINRAFSLTITTPSAIFGQSVFGGSTFG